MNKYDVTTDVFTISYKDDKTILYAPLVGFACIANSDLIDFLINIKNVTNDNVTSDQQQILDYLIQKKVINGKQEGMLNSNNSKTLSPAKLTLFPTNKCNLQCCYCYAAEDCNAEVSMDLEIAVSAIEYFISLCKKENRTNFPMELHGGGEPLYAWPLVAKIIEQAEKRCKEENLRYEVNAATNGVLSEKQLHWIIKHFKALNISFEGLPRIQDLQRPLKNGGSSFKHVDKTIRFFDKNNFPYGIRTTVTKHNENLLEETIDFITSNYKTKLIFFEPVYLCAEYKLQEDSLKPDFFKFVEKFEQLKQVCIDRGVQLEYSGCQFNRIKNTFCYVGTGDFAVTPEGLITNCWEVTNPDHPLADIFIFGKILPFGQIEIDQKKIDYLRTFSVNNFDYCKDCFAKWHCAGDCVTKLGHNNFHGPRGGNRCETNMLLIANQVIRLLENDNCFYNEINSSRLK